MILAPLLASLELLINPLLRLDPATLQRLGKLEGKVVQVEITDWAIQYFLLPKKNGIELTTGNDFKSDCKISGKLLNLCQVFCQRAASPALFKQNISIEGDVELAEQLRDIMQHLDIDWEELFARALGDSVGQKVSWQFSKWTNFAVNTAKTLHQNTLDYLQAEANYLPPKTEVELFYQRVDTLREDVERAEARIKRLTSKAE